MTEQLTDKERALTDYMLKTNGRKFDSAYMVETFNAGWNASTPTIPERVTDEEIKEGDWVTGEFLGETFIRKVVKYYGNIRTQLLNGSQPSGNLVEPPQYWTYSGERYQQLSNCKKTKSNIGNSIALRNELESFAKSIYPNDYKREDAFITGADWERDRLSQSPVRGEEEIKKNTKPFDAGSPDNYKRA